QSEKMLFQTKVLDNGSSLKAFVYIRSHLPNERYSAASFLEKYTVRYAVYEEYGGATPIVEARTLDLSPLTLQNYKQGIYFSIDINKLSQPFAILWVQVINNNSKQINRKDIPLYFTQTQLGQAFGVFDPTGTHPNFHDYVVSGESFKIKDLTNSAAKLYVNRFQQDYDAALAPMYLNKPTTNATMQMDSSFVINSSEILTLEKEGIYLFRKDTADFYGIGLRVEPKGFPKLTQKEQLVKPLTYISTVEELQKLKGASDLKKELDRFWLRLTNGKVALAKKTVKDYYQRIKLSNIMFTTFKEGWKTDMGMIYTVFGYPNEINYGKDVIQWTYKKGGKNFNQVSFKFRRKANQFTQEHYTLVRYVEYEPIWYPVVELWRKGVATR
ncbi:MAG: GWxTD domain-containing protein, partial [Bacteroidota bacterium]